MSGVGEADGAAASASTGVAAMLVTAPAIRIVAIVLDRGESFILKFLLVRVAQPVPSAGSSSRDWRFLGTERRCQNRRAVTICQCALIVQKSAYGVSCFVFAVVGVRPDSPVDAGN